MFIIALTPKLRLSITNKEYRSPDILVFSAMSVIIQVVTNSFSLSLIHDYHIIKESAYFERFLMYVILKIKSVF